MIGFLERMGSSIVVWGPDGCNGQQFSDFKFEILFMSRGVYDYGKDSWIIVDSVTVVVIFSKRRNLFDRGTNHQCLFYLVWQQKRIKDSRSRQMYRFSRGLEEEITKILQEIIK